MSLAEAFESLLEHSLEGTKLVLGTRAGRPIPNMVTPEPDERRKKYWQRQVAARSRWVVRRPCCGGYNCAGLIWASRRTSIEGEYGMILSDDGYRQITGQERPMRGDLALYVMDGGIQVHVGLVLGDDESAQVLGSGLLAAPKGVLGGANKNAYLILSKWDNSSPEIIHSQDDHVIQELAQLEFWTERPLIE